MDDNMLIEMDQLNMIAATEDDMRFVAVPVSLYMLGHVDTSAFIMNLRRVVPPNEEESKPLKGRKDVMYDQRIRNMISHEGKNDVIKRLFYMIIKSPEGVRSPAKFYITDLEGSQIRRPLIDAKQDEWFKYLRERVNSDVTFFPSENAVRFAKRFIFAGMPDTELVNNASELLGFYDSDFTKRIFSAFGFHILGWNQNGDPTAYIVKTEKEYCCDEYTENELAFIKSRMIPSLCYICVVREDEDTGLITGLDMIDVVAK